MTFPDAGLHDGRRLDEHADAIHRGDFNKRAPPRTRLFTTVAAAERFVRLRMKSMRDLRLVEFGNGPTSSPRSHDYDSILLSTVSSGPLSSDVPIRHDHRPGIEEAPRSSGVTLLVCVRQSPW